MLSAKLLSSLPEELGVVTFFLVFLPLHSAGLNYLLNFGMSFALCYVVIFIAEKFIASKWMLEDESEARDLTLKTKQFEVR